jgi:hypothetical protein
VVISPTLTHHRITYSTFKMADFCGAHRSGGPSLPPVAHLLLLLLLLLLLRVVLMLLSFAAVIQEIPMAWRTHWASASPWKVVMLVLLPSVSDAVIAPVILCTQSLLPAVLSGGPAITWRLPS